METVFSAAVSRGIAAPPQLYLDTNKQYSLVSEDSYIPYFLAGYPSSQQTRLDVFTAVRCRADRERNVRRGVCCQ
jgi:hypothetical protein